ncbi:MAG: haloacid dehalogenase [Patescibacteria group bacterium]|nr:MAG: haloacid dehalogenase [Patescibacteria group bacterium]
MSYTIPKVIVFDVGGVLLNWRTGLNAISLLLNSPPEDVYMYLIDHLRDLELGHIDGETFWKHVAEDYKYKYSPKNLAECWITERGRLSESWKLLKDLSSLYRLAVCTNLWSGMFDVIRKGNPDVDLFETVVDSSQVGVVKPDPKMYKIVEERTGSSGKELFLIDDSKENCDGAEKCGWQSYKFMLGEDSGKASCDEIRKILLS